MIDNGWNATLYDQKHAFVFSYGRSLLALLEPQPGERILDVGCGTGHLTQAIASAGAQVVGIDSAPSMIEAARAAYPTLAFEVADVRDFSFPRPFDALFSNAVLHWVPEAEAAVRCMARALKVGGRLVLEMGGRGNVAALVAAVEEAAWELLQMRLTSPWFFPSLAEYASLLEHNDLEVRAAWLFERPTPLEDGERGLRIWLEMFGAPLLSAIPESQRAAVIARAEERARPRLFRAGQWIADYRRLRIVAYKR